MDASFFNNFDPNYTDKNTTHSYLSHYESLLREVMVKVGNNLTVAEVGIQRGGSILGWLKTLPTATVYGIDCQKTIRLDHPRYKELILNAYDEDNLSKFPMDVDFFVEDGSHAYSDLVFVVKNYPQFLSKNGILVIEDIPDTEWVPKLLLRLPPGFTSQFLDLRSERNGRWDNMLLVIRRKTAPDMPTPMYSMNSLSQYLDLGPKKS